jgi:hypothetical protein
MSRRPFEVILGPCPIDIEILKEYPIDVPGDVALEAPESPLSLSFLRRSNEPCHPESLRLE